MSCKEGIDFISKYHQDRADQLVNCKKLTWSKAHLSISAFSRDAENSEYKSLTPGGDDVGDQIMKKIRLVRTKIAWLCACYRDIKMQYLATRTNNRQPMDAERHMASFYGYLYSTFWAQTKSFLGL